MAEGSPHSSARRGGKGSGGGGPRRSLPPAPSPLNPRSRRLSLPSSASHPHRTANKIPLHSDFDTVGDIVLVCSDGEQMIGFKVHSVALRTVW